MLLPVGGSFEALMGSRYGYGSFFRSLLSPNFLDLIFVRL